jgi:hypothetical protein
MKGNLVKHVKVRDGTLLIRPAGGDPDVMIPLDSIRDVKLPFGRVIVRTDHSRHDLRVTDLDLKELDELRDLLVQALNRNRSQRS